MSRNKFFDTVWRHSKVLIPFCTLRWHQDYTDVCQYPSSPLWCSQRSILCFSFMSTTPSSSWCVWTGLESLWAPLLEILIRIAWMAPSESWGLCTIHYVMLPSTDGKPLSPILWYNREQGQGSGRPATFQFLKWARVLPSARHSLPFSFWLIFQEWILIYKTLLSWGADCSENQSPGSKFSSLVV